MTNHMMSTYCFYTQTMRLNFLWHVDLPHTQPQSLECVTLCHVNRNIQCTINHWTATALTGRFCLSSLNYSSQFTR